MYHRRTTHALVLLFASAALTSVRTADAQSAPGIPLVTGLTVVTAVHTPRGDAESIKQVVAVDEAGVRIRYSGRRPEHGDRDGRIDVMRRVRAADLARGRRYKVSFANNDEEVEPGATAIGTSTLVLEELAQGHQIAFWVIDEAGMSSGSVFEAPSLVADFKGTLTRVESTPVRLPVLVRGKRVMLPTIHAHGRFGDGANAREADLWFLDDPRNPLTLRMTFGTGGLQVVRIDYPAADSVRPIERALAKRDTAVVYGLYFELASATIRPESRPVLDEIAGVMKAHPDWTLRLAGHTDSVGTAAANLELSRRRAEAVKSALVSLGIAGGRLEATGYGAAAPKESNNTLEGRARNRRVELTRR